MPTLGAEIEKPISKIKTGEPHGVSQGFFNRVTAMLNTKPEYSDIEPGTIIGTTSDQLHVGLDNAFNLQETSIPNPTTDILELEEWLKTDLRIVQKALTAEGATVINLSIHPLGQTNDESYKAFVAPKGVYKYIALRGWDHKAGIDAKAQNSPSTGVEPELAAKALTTIIGSSAAFIGIFANSPFCGNRLSPCEETRLTMWERFMENSSSEGDKVTARFPQKPFESLKDYFNWMFGPGTNIHFVMASGGSYKTFGDQAILIDGNPAVLDYLRMQKAKGKLLNSGKEIIVEPVLSHLEAMQFAQFSSARIRYKFNHQQINKHDFLEAFDNDKLEELLAAKGLESMYIEGRDPGANFPDRQLREKGENLAWSTVISPSALQVGLINNLDEASAYIRSFDWQTLGELRNAAIVQGLGGRAEGLQVREFATKIVEVAAKGLTSKQHRLLEYPLQVIASNENGADRALKDYYQGKSITEIVKSRNVEV